MCQDCKICNECKQLKQLTEFKKDATRHDGYDYKCKECRKKIRLFKYIPKSRISKFGTRFSIPRDNDKEQARGRINTMVNRGLLPDPNTIKCIDCGHIGQDIKHAYDHYLGYAAEHHEHVQVVCYRCHSKRDDVKTKATKCINGHDYTLENTGRKSNGTRFCKECHRIYDRKRRDAAFWRAYRLKRKQNG